MSWKLSVLFAWMFAEDARAACMPADQSYCDVHVLPAKACALCMRLCHQKMPSVGSSIKAVLLPSLPAGRRAEGHCKVLAP